MTDSIDKLKHEKRTKTIIVEEDIWTTTDGKEWNNIYVAIGHQVELDKMKWYRRWKLARHFSWYSEFWRRWHHHAVISNNPSLWQKRKELRCKSSA